MDFHLCSCQNLAIYYYAPGSSDPNQQRYFCDGCVPRGCFCNHEYVDPEAYDRPLDEPNNPPTDSHDWKWLEDCKIWCYVDGQGREYPCCEFWYDSEGWEIETPEEKI